MENSVIIPTMLTVRQAAERYGLSPAFVRRLCREGIVRYVAVGRTRWLVNERSLIRFLEQGELIPAAEQGIANGIRRVET